MASALLDAPRPRAIRRRSLGLSAAAALAAIGLLAPASPGRQDDGSSTDPAAAQPAAEVAREREIAERFLTLLERNPRPGTALDRAYAFFAERGELAQLADRLRSRMEEDADDAAAPAILGLIESRRGNDAAAIAAFEAAAQRAPDDPNPRARLAEALALAGRPGEAAAAYEAALARDPARRDLPELLSGLGRALTRAGRAEETAAVWERLIEQFPGDDAVREQIAAVLEAEGDLDGALARYEALAGDATDEYARVSHGLKAAGLKVRLGRTEDAVADFEALLANLNPDSWLFREVRGGIERSFLRTDDLAGLTGYYEGWVEEHPEDVAAMARLGELLDRQNRTAEARTWLEQAVEKAPGDGRLRRALVAQLLRAEEYAAAAEQFEALNEQAPGDADTLRDWGSVFLSDPSLSQEERLAKAEAVWRRLLDAQGEDPVAVTRVADWLRQAGDEDGAKALYRRAVELAPEDPRYREYLGEYLHVLGESEEAAAVWNELAAGENRSVRTLARLSEVLGGFGYDERAADAAAEADALDVREAGADDPSAGALEFADRMRFAELFSRAGRADAAEAQVAKAEALAVTTEERRAALTAAIAADEAAGRLQDRIAELQATAAAEPQNADVRLRLALYHDAAGDTDAAAAAAEKAAALDPRDATALATLSELQERAGRLIDAVATARRLADVDRQRRADHLMRVAELQLRLGQRAEALRTAREVVAGAPGNPEGLQFLSRIAFRTGDEEAGFDALRRAARSASRDVGPLLALSGALADRFRTDEAVELLWRAFQSVDGFEDKALVVRRLTALAQRQGRFDRFLEKLEDVASGRRGGVAVGGVGLGGAGEGPDREAALLIAEAHLAADDPAAARETLEPLLTRDPRDTALLARLATLAESAGDLEDAVGFQRRVVEQSDAPAERMRLAGLLTAAGNDAEAEPYFLELLGGQTDPAERVRAIDRLLGAGRASVAFRLADAGLARNGDDWELLSRLALAAVSADDGELTSYPTSLDVTPLRPLRETLDEESRKRIADAALRRVWELDLPADAPSAAAKAAAERERARRAGNTGRITHSGGGLSYPPELLRWQQVYPALPYLGLIDQSQGSMSMPRRTLFDPEEYATARLLAATWLGHRNDAFAQQVFADAGVDLRLDRTEESANDAAEESGDAAESRPTEAPEPNPNPTERELWDAYHLANLGPRVGLLPPVVRSSMQGALRQLAGGLVRQSGADQAASMAYFNSLGARMSVREGAEEPEPLSTDELALLERAAEQLAADERTGSAYGSRALGAFLLELKRAGHTERAQARIAAIVDEADEPAEIQAAAMLLSGSNLPVSQLGRPEDLDALLERAAALPPDQQAAALPPANVLAQLAAARTAEDDLEGAFRLLDLHAEAAAAASTAGSSATGAPMQAVAVSSMSSASRTGRSATSGRSLSMWIPQQSGRFTHYHAGEQGFPPPALPIDDNQVTLLRSQTMWLRQPELLDPLREEGDDTKEEDDEDVDREGEAEEPAAEPSPLLAHLRTRVERAGEASREAELLRLSCVEAWSGNVEAAVAALDAALELAPDDAALRRVVAAAKVEQGDPAAGLALLDAVEPTDPDALRERELMALRTASAAGDLDRAKAAAERLFGLRMSNKEQLELASSMQRLGMGEQASAVLARMRQTAGNDAQALAGLMDLHRRRGENETAAEIARTALSRFRPANTPPNQGRTAAQYQAEAARRQAVQVLRDLGELEPVLADLRAKLERNPNAESVRTELVSLLNDAGQGDEATALMQSVAPSGNNAAAFVTAAQTAYSSRDYATAADFYLQALEKDPSTVARDVNAVFRAFDQAGRASELIEAAGKTDPADWGGQRQMLAYLLQRGASDSDSKPAAMAAFESLWKNHEELRDELFMRADGTPLMELDGVYDYAVERLLTGGTRADWNRLSNVSRWSNGQPVSDLNRLLDVAEKREAAPALVERIEREREAAPDWEPGRLLLAAAQAAAGDADAARKQVEALLLLPKDERPPAMAWWVLSVELERDEDLADLALTLMRRAVEENATSSMANNGFEYTPRSRLAELLSKAGEKREARELLMTEAFDPPERSPRNVVSFRSNPQYEARRKVQSLSKIGKQLATLGFPLDGLRVLDAAMADAASAGFAPGDWELRQLTDAAKEVREQLTAADIAEQLTARLEQDRAAQAAGEPVSPEPALDLFVTATDGGDDMQNAAIVSSLIAALVQPEDVKNARNRGNPFGNQSQAAGVRETDEQAVEDVPVSEEPDGGAAPDEQTAALRKLLAEALELRPDDLSLHATAALLALDAEDVAAAKPSIAAALRLAQEERNAAESGEPADEEPADEEPADEEPADEEPADEGDDAAGPAPATVGVWWLVGVEAAGHEATVEDGRALMNAALAAADALPDRTWRVALRVSAGQAALDRGDEAAAEAHWERLLGDLLDRDLAADPQAAAAPPGEAGARLSPPPVGVRGALLIAALATLDDPPTDESNAEERDPAIPVTTGPRARRALRLAQLAADRGLVGLSLRAVRETLGGGPPLDGGSGSSSQATYQVVGGGFVTQSNNGGGMFGGDVASAAPTDDDGEPLSNREIGQTLLKLSQAWTKAEADPAAVAATLREIVLPEARPTEAFVYVDESGLAGMSSMPSDAVTPLLQWTKRAGALDLLRDRVADRVRDGKGGLPLELLRVRLALATEQTDEVAELLRKMTKDVALAGDRQSGVLLVYAAGPALDTDLASPEAAEAFLAATKLIVGNGGLNSRYTKRLAEAAFARGENDAAIAFLDQLVARARLRRGQDPQQEASTLAAVVQDLAEGGAVREALQRLAEYEELQTGDFYSNAFDFNIVVANLSDGFARLPAEERFEALRDWTLPRSDAGEPTGTVRGMEGWQSRGEENDAMRSLAALLVAAAEETGRTAELITALDRADAARAAKADAAVEEKPAEQAEELVDASDRTPMNGSGNGDEAPTPAPPAVDAVRSATLRLLADQPTDVPAAFDAAAEMRAWAAREVKNSKGWLNRMLPAQQALAANLLLVQTVLERPEHQAAAAAEVEALMEWTKANRGIRYDVSMPLNALQQRAKALNDEE